MSLDAVQTVYESSIAFGIRKALMAEQGMEDRDDKVRLRFDHTFIPMIVQKLSKNWHFGCEIVKVKQAEETIKQMEITIAELKLKCESSEKRDAERKQMEERKHAEEVSFLKKTNLQLKVMPNCSAFILKIYF